MAAGLLWEWGNQGSRLAVKCWMRQRLCHQVIVTGLPVSVAASVVIHLHVETMTREDSQITPTNLIRLNPSKAKATFLQSTRTNIFKKSSKSCHNGIYWKALAEYCQMSTHEPGIKLFLSYFESFCIGHISYQHHKALHVRIS